jgi:hypothetical protein
VRAWLTLASAALLILVLLVSFVSAGPPGRVVRVGLLYSTAPGD